MEILDQKNEAMLHAGRLHWYHWLIICFSLVLTLSAWYISKNQVDQRLQIVFDREADQVIELITERMQKYEDVLWGGVSTIKANGGDIAYDKWAIYAENLRIEEKYPGINGVGVIHYVSQEKRAEYLKNQRKLRPDYRIHPEHDKNEFLPISYIEPADINSKAIGLDMAHEVNRYTASLKARDTGLAQITGPIVLVQDEGHTPGFLFFAPWYEKDDIRTPEDRRESFAGVVYAPFIVSKLMDGTLEKQKRQVNIRFMDGEDRLYDELDKANEDFDGAPLFKREISLEVYGRHWNFNIWSSKSFRKSADNNQPLVILIGGIIIDSLLLGLFIIISNSNKKALSFARLMSQNYQDKADELSRNVQILSESNQELDQFAYIASHDLKEPLRGISSYSQFLIEDYEDKLGEEGKEKLHTLVKLAARMDKLISDLLYVSRIGRTNLKIEDVDLDALLSNKILDTLEYAVADKNVEIKRDAPLPLFPCDKLWVTALFQNLISNAIKYNDKSNCCVEIGHKISHQEIIFYVKDNGIGIEERHLSEIFKIFKRLHGRDKFNGGSGAGLFIVKKIIDRHKGRIWVSSEKGIGTTFYFTLKDMTHEGK